MKTEFKLDEKIIELKRNKELDFKGFIQTEHVKQKIQDLHEDLKKKVDKRRFPVMKRWMGFCVELEKVDKSLLKEIQNIMEIIDIGGMIDDIDKTFQKHIGDGLLK